jgi:hypothetical protein
VLPLPNLFSFMQTGSEASSRHVATGTGPGAAIAAASGRQASNRRHHEVIEALDVTVDAYHVGSHHDGAVERLG